MTEETKDMTQETTTADAPNLTLQDLANIKSIVDIAAQRGAFKAGEMAAVGVIYNKLSLFLDSVAGKDKEKDPA